MLAIDAQIKRAYEEEGMTPQQIADDQALYLGAVKAKLISISSKYRKDVGMEQEIEDDGLNFTDDELREMNQIIVMTAKEAEHSDGSIDYKTRLTAALYIRDDKKGRKELHKHLQHQPFNLLNFNVQMEQSRLAAQQAKQLIGNTRTVDV